MRILLPPSEAKRPAGNGDAIGSLPPGPLARPRQRVVRTVRRVARGPRGRAADTFLLPPTVRDQALAANAVVDESPTMPALDRYDGVLYRALDPATLTPAQRARANTSVTIFSGLLGVVGGGELVPDYRVPAAAVLPGLGGVGRWWRPHVAALLDPMAEEELIVDMRSSDYQPMWHTPETVVAIRVLVDHGGTRRTVSFTAKHGKGLLARALLRRRTPPRSFADVATTAEALGYTVEARPGGLDLITAPGPVQTN